MIRIFESVQRVSICNILCTIKNGGLHMRKMGKHIPGLIVTLVVLITAGPDRDRRSACMEYGW